MSESSDLKLDLTEVYQEAIVGHMMRDFPFFISCCTQLEKEWFKDLHVAVLFMLAKQFYDDNGRKLTSPDEFFGIVKQAYPMKHGVYTGKFTNCMMSSKKIGLDVLSTRLTSWIKFSKFKQALVEATNQYNRKDKKASIDWITEELKVINKASFAPDEAIVFNDMSSFMEEREEMVGECVTTGHPLLDEALLEGAATEAAGISLESPDTIAFPPDKLDIKTLTTGGLMKGDTTMILGPSNSGKTTTVISMIVANLFFGKKVLYITHEMKWEDIKTKVYQRAFQKSATELTNYSKSEEDIDQLNIKTVSNMIHGQLKYYSWLKAGDMYVESVVAHINLLQERELANTGTGYDLLVVDYPGKLQSKRHGQKHSTWESLDYIYDQFVNLALEHRFHAILPVQTNRDGFKVNQGASNRLVNQGDVGGSFGLMQRASNVITLNRSPAEIEREVMQFNIAKSRSSATERVFYTRTDFAKSANIAPFLKCGVYSVDENGAMAPSSLFEKLDATK